MAMFSLCSRVFRKSGRKNRRLDIATIIRRRGYKYLSPSRQFFQSTNLGSVKVNMESAVINSFIALCVVVAVSNPTANAVPMTSYQQWISIQQSSTLNEITKALGVNQLIMDTCTLLVYSH